MASKDLNSVGDLMAAVKKLARGKSSPEWRSISTREQELRRQKIKREFEESELVRRKPEMALTGVRDSS